MIFDVMVREGHNADGKQIIQVYRTHDSQLNSMLRKIQDDERYIIAVIPLFRQKREEVSIAVGAGVAEEDEEEIVRKLYKKPKEMAIEEEEKGYTEEQEF